MTPVLLLIFFFLFLCKLSTTVPKERCTITPQTICDVVEKLVPILTQEVTCVDVPKEICVKEKTNPTRVKEPVTKTFCRRIPTLKKNGVTAASR